MSASSSSAASSAQASDHRFSHVGTSVEDIGPRLLHVLQESSVIVSQQDRDLRYVWIVNAFEGIDPEDIVDCRDCDILTHEAEARSHEAAKMDVMRTGESTTRELPVTIGGTTRFYDYTIAPVTDEEGAIDGVTCVAVEVTQRHQRERSLRRSRDEAEAARSEAEREREEAREAYNAEKSRREADNEEAAQDNSREMILGRAGHALNTPLTAVLSQISVLEAMELGRADTVLQRLRRSADRLAQAVDEVLDLSRLEAGGSEYAPEPVAFANTVLETVEMLRGEAEEKDINIQTERPDDQARVSVDPQALERVTSNLVENAVKYSDDGGRVLVRIRTVDDTTVAMDVEDDGIGISEEFREQLFEPFARSDEARRAAGGTGLGLAITLRLVQTMGGEMDVDSVPGKGSRFTVRIPRVD